MDGDVMHFDLGGAKRRKVRNDTCESSYIELPCIALSVISFLQVRDVLSLGSCSKYLNELLKTEEVRMELYKRRWQDLPTNTVNFKGWKTTYIGKHRHWEAFLFSHLLGTVENCIESETMHRRQYLKAINKMDGLKLGFEDIYLYFFKKNINVLFNLLGLHYLFFCLGMPLEDLRRVLASCQVAEKEVRVSWRLDFTRDYKFYMPAEEYHRTSSLGQIADDDVALLYLLKAVDRHPYFFHLGYVRVSSNFPSED